MTLQHFSKQHTVNSIEDLLKFCEAAVEHASACAGKPVDPSTIYLQQPLDIWACEVELSDGSKVYDVTHQPVKEG